MLLIHLLGSPEIVRDGHLVPVARRKTRALLFYLATRRGPTSRDHVIDLLWADLPRPAAQQTLRATLYGLRKAIGPVLAGDDMLQLDPGTDVDVWELDDALGGARDRAQLAAALGRYRGDFLDGFSLPDVPAFDDWVGGTRERYRQAVVRGLSALARSYEAAASYRDALDALDRALTLDPLQEDVQRDAMRLQYLAGDRVGAIRRYEQLRLLLDDELGVPPMAETRAIYDAIIRDEGGALAPDVGSALSGATPQRDGQRASVGAGARTPKADSASGPQTPLALPFIGRATELNAIGAAATARQLVLVEGEPGIGKSRLVGEFLRRGSGLTLVGAARELDQALPYQPFVEALRGLLEHPEWPTLRGSLGISPVWLAEINRLLPDLTPAGISSPPPSSADESRVREGVSQLVRALARRGAVTIFLDDAHWADAASLGLLGYLVRQRLPGVALLATARPVDPRSPLAMTAQALMREGLLGRVRLARLGEHETRQLARYLSPKAADELAAWLMRNGEGNPYIIAELVRHARTAGILGPDGSLQIRALGDDSPVVPPTIYTLIASRLARLSDPARRVLDAAVAVGREFDTDVVAHAAALSDEAALDALDELTATGLVRRVDGSGFAFDHSLTMEVAYHEVGEARHRLTHRRVAEALEAVHRRRLDGVAGLIAMHYVEGGALERAVPYALRAARRAVGMAAWTEAIGFYQMALDGVEDAERVAVLQGLAEAHQESGEYAQAAEVFREAASFARGRRDRQGVVASQLGLAEALISQGRFAEVFTIVRQVAATEDPAVRAGVELMWGTALSLEGADLDSAAAHLRRAEAIAASQPDEEGAMAQLAHARFELGNVLAQQGDLEGAVTRYREALAVAASGGEAAANWYILSYNNLAYHLHLLGDSSALTYARSGLSLAQERGVIGFQPYLLSTLGEIALAQGDVTTAERHFSEGLALAERLSIAERVAGLGANLGLVAVRRGQSSLAIHRLSTAQARADTLGTRHLAAQIRVWLAPLLPADEARATLAEARSIAESGGRRRLLEEIVEVEQTLA